MKTQIQTRIGLAVGLILALLAGLAPRAEAVSATGGTVTNYAEGGTNFTAHIFTNSGVFTNLTLTSVEVLVVAGGGGGVAATTPAGVARAA